jgi:hypothetical protein
MDCGQGAAFSEATVVVDEGVSDGVSGSIDKTNDVTTGWKLISRLRARLTASPPIKLPQISHVMPYDISIFDLLWKLVLRSFFLQLQSTVKSCYSSRILLDPRKWTTKKAQNQMSSPPRIASASSVK